LAEGGQLDRILLLQPFDPRFYTMKRKELLHCQAAAFGTAVASIIGEISKQTGY